MNKIIGIVAIISTLLFSQGILANTWPCGGLKQVIANLKVST